MWLFFCSTYFAVFLNRFFILLPVCWWIKFSIMCMCLIVVSVCTIVKLRHWVSLAPLFVIVYITVLNCVCYLMFIWWFVLYYCICTVPRGRYCVIQYSCHNTNKTIIIIIYLLLTYIADRAKVKWLARKFSRLSADWWNYKRIGEAGTKVRHSTQLQQQQLTSTTGITCPLEGVSRYVPSPMWWVGS